MPVENEVQAIIRQGRTYKLDEQTLTHNINDESDNENHDEPQQMMQCSRCDNDEDMA